MNRYELIDTARQMLNAAKGFSNVDQHEHYAEHMQLLIDLLLDEFCGSAPKSPKSHQPERNQNHE